MRNTLPIDGVHKPQDRLQPAVCIVMRLEPQASLPSKQLGVEPLDRYGTFLSCKVSADFNRAEACGNRCIQREDRVVIDLTSGPVSIHSLLAFDAGLPEDAQIHIVTEISVIIGKQLDGEFSQAATPGDYCSVIPSFPQRFGLVLAGHRE